MLHEQGDIFWAFAQRRDIDHHHLEAVKKILAELAGGDHLLDIPVGCGNEPHIDADRGDAAHPQQGSLLDNPQKLDLHGDGHLADLIEKDGAAVSRLKQAELSAHRAGEGPLFVAEKLIGHQLFAEGPAIEGNKGMPAATAGAVQRLGHQFLAGAGLPLNEHVAAERRDLTDGLEYLLHGRGAANDPGKAIGKPGFRFAAATLSPGVQQGIAHGVAQFLKPERLGQIVIGSGLHGPDRMIDRGVAGHHDNLGRRSKGYDPLQDIQAVGIV